MEDCCRDTLGTKERFWFSLWLNLMIWSRCMSLLTRWSNIGYLFSAMNWLHLQYSVSERVLMNFNCCSILTCMSIFLLESALAELGRYLIYEASRDWLVSSWKWPLDSLFSFVNRITVAQSWYVGNHNRRSTNTMRGGKCGVCRSKRSSEGQWIIALVFDGLKFVTFADSQSYI